MPPKGIENKVTRDSRDALEKSDLPSHRDFREVEKGMWNLGPGRPPGPPSREEVEAAEPLKMADPTDAWDGRLSSSCTSQNQGAGADL